MRKSFLLSICFLVFLLAVLPLTVSLVQKRQEYRGKAETSQVSKKEIYVQYHTWYDTPFDGSPDSFPPHPRWFEWSKQNWQVPNSNSPDTLKAGSNWERDIASAVGYPLIGPYDCDNREVLRWHVRLAKAAGIKGLLVSIFQGGKNSAWEQYGIDNFATMLEVAKEEDYKLGLELWVPQSTADYNEKVRFFTDLLKHFKDHPAFLRIEGKPVMWFASGYNEKTGKYSWGDKTEQDSILRDVERNIGEDVYWVMRGWPQGDEVNVITGAENLDGIDAPNNWFNNWEEYEQKAEEFKLDVERRGKKPALHLYPGFDESAIANSQGGQRYPPRYRSRLNGDRLKKALEAGEKKGIYSYYLESFNDWTESTQIEPGWYFDGFNGDYYQSLRTIASFIGKTFTPPPLPPAEELDPLVREKLEPTPSPTLPPGERELEDIEYLPLIKDNVQVGQFSSTDPTGGNMDAENYIRKEGDKYVIFEATGPGSIYRIWFTFEDGYDIGNIQFYFDGETTPRIDRPVPEFFSGNTQNRPFVTPLVGNKEVSSGGYYSYVPIHFEKSSKITLTKKPRYYAITYYKYTDNRKIVSYTEEKDYSRIINQWQNVGLDPKDRTGILKLAGQVELGGTQNKIVADLKQAGMISSIKMKAEPATETTLRNIKLKISWDGETKPSINIPIGPFFGSDFGEVNFQSLLVGMGREWYYNYFPMPYWNSARIELENGGESKVNVKYEVEYKNKAYDKETGYFLVKYSERGPTSSGLDYSILETTGKGHFVGTILFMEATLPSGWYLEGDEKIYIDNSDSPVIQGTGTEDYFNGGYYFSKGTFNLPLHGSHLKNWNTNKKTAAYRFHISDAIPYQKYLKFGIEHGGVNDVAAIYSSVAYYYQKAREEPQKLSSLSFKIKFQGVSQQRPGQKVKLTLAKDGNIINTFENVGVSSDQNGIYSGTITNITPGTYDVFIKGWAHLQKKFGNVSLNEGANSQDWSGTILKAGDFNNDNKLDIMDISAILSKYTALSVPVDETNRIYNIDSNSVINIADIAIVLTNYTALTVPGD